MDIRKYFSSSQSKQIVKDGKGKTYKDKTENSRKRCNEDKICKNGIDDNEVTIDMDSDFEEKIIKTNDKIKSKQNLKKQNVKKVHEDDDEEPIPKRKRKVARKRITSESDSEKDSKIKHVNIDDDYIDFQIINKKDESDNSESPIPKKKEFTKLRKSDEKQNSESPITASDYFSRIKTKTNSQEKNDIDNQHKKSITVSELRRSPRKCMNKNIDIIVDEKMSSPRKTKYVKVISKSPIKSIKQTEKVIEEVNEDSFTKISPRISNNEQNKESKSKTHKENISFDFKAHFDEIKEATVKNKDVPVSQMWVDKYKPLSSKLIVGQHGDRSNAKKLSNWLMNWDKNRDKKPIFSKFGSDDASGFKAALLSGPPGIGKTTTAQLVCKEQGYDYVELNASDTRSKKLLEEEISALLDNKSLGNFFNNKITTNSKHALIMDEVDGMAGNEDRGGILELIQLIKKTQIPIICICNDRANQKMRSLVNYCYDLRFYRPRVDQIKSSMMSICFKEKLNISNDALQELIVSSNQDIRQILHYLSLMRAKNDKVDKLISSQAIKDVKLSPFDAVKKVFTSGPEYNQMSFNDKSALFFNDYSLMPLFCYENYLRVNPIKAKNDKCKKLRLAAKSIDALAFSDIIDKEIRHSQRWNLLPLQAVFSTVMPGFYMNGTMPPMSSFPTLLGRISTVNRKDRLLQELYHHMSSSITGDKTALNLDYLQPLRISLTKPLIDKGADGVSTVIERLNEYNLLKDDIDNIIELSLWPHQKDPMSKLDSKTKAAFTRSFNKSTHLLPYSTSNVGKIKKVTNNANDMILQEGEEEETNNDDEENEKDDDDISKDAMIKAKKVTKKETKTTAKTKEKQAASAKTKKGKK